MTEFEERLKRAVKRGQHRSEQQAAEQRAQALDEEELKRLHTKYRVLLAEHIERCVEQLIDHFPGFQYETIYGDRGWGAAVKRDDVHARSGGRSSHYSRLEMTIRPYSTSHVLDLNAKGTIRNREIFNRKHFERLTEADPDTYQELIDVWVLEFAEIYASKS